MDSDRLQALAEKSSESLEASRKAIEAASELPRLSLSASSEMGLEELAADAVLNLCHAHARILVLRSLLAGVVDREAERGGPSGI